MKSLFLDKLDGTLRFKNNEGLRIESIFFQSFKFIETKINYNGKNLIFWNNAAEFVSKELNIPIDRSKNVFRDILSGSDSLIDIDYTISANFFHYKSRGNYLFSKPLKECLESCSINASEHIIPNDICAYMEIPNLKDDYGDDILYLIVSSWKINESSRKLVLSGLTSNKNKDVSRIATSFVLVKGETIEKAYLKAIANFHARSLDPERNKLLEENTSTEDITYKDKSWSKTALNALIYIFSESEELHIELNEFSKKKSKREGQQKIYTTKPFVRVGNSFEFLRLVSENESQWTGHFRWQKCGKGLKSTKLTWVRPHTKKFKKFKPNLEK